MQLYIIINIYNYIQFYIVYNCKYWDPSILTAPGFT